MGYLKSRLHEQLPPSAPPYTGGEMITKRFPRLCKEGLGVVVESKLTC